jgi:hypothetical protein
MLFDKRYNKPSDNPLRVIAYAAGACLAAYALVVALSLAASAGNYGENTGVGSSGWSGSSDRASTTWSTGGWFRDPMVAGGGPSYGGRYTGAMITSGNGWGATGLAGGGCCSSDRLGTSYGQMETESRGSGVTAW